jgi:hypothetical protein
MELVRVFAPGTPLTGLLLASFIVFAGCTSPCGNLQSASTAFNSKAEPCYGDAGYSVSVTDAGSADAGASDGGSSDAGSPATSAATFNEVVCENDVVDCSMNDVAILNKYATCLNNLPVCSPSTQQTWSSSVQACTNELGALTSKCMAALSGNGSGFP